MPLAGPQGLAAEELLLPGLSDDALLTCHLEQCGHSRLDGHVPSPWKPPAWLVAGESDWWSGTRDGRSPARRDPTALSLSQASARGKRPSRSSSSQCTASMSGLCRDGSRTAFVTRELARSYESKVGL